MKSSKGDGTILVKMQKNVRRGKPGCHKKVIVF